MLFGFTPCIQIKQRAEAAVSSNAIQKGLSIINIGAISRKAMKVVEGAVGLFFVRKQPKIKRREIDK